MVGNAKFNAAALISLVVVIIVIGSAFAITYSSLSSQISSNNQKISELNGKITDQNTTISFQNSTISNLRSNESNLSLIIATLKSEMLLENGNYSKLNLLLSWIKTAYGIQYNILAYNATISVPSHEYRQLTHYINPSNNTTIVFLPTASINGVVNGNGTSTVQNVTYSVTSAYSQGAVWGPPITLPNFELYVYNMGTASLNFNFTLLMIWRS